MESDESNKTVYGSDGAGINDVDTENVNENNSLVQIKTTTFGFTQPSGITDFCLVVEGTKLYVTKLILSLASPVLNTMFQSEFKEKSCDELELPGKKLTDVIAFLRCIYPNTCAEINFDTAMTILPLLEEYQVLQHKPRCEAVLLDGVTEETTTDELLQILKQACMYDLKKLREKCIFLISSRPCDVLDDSNCRSFLSESELNEIFLNVNTSMKNKLAELEQNTEENELLKKYINTEILSKNANVLKLDPGKKWDDKTIVLIEYVPTHNNESKGKVVDIWEIPFKVCMKNFSNILYCVIKNVGHMEVTCDISAYCILVNRKPTGCNHVVNYTNRRFSSVSQIEISYLSTVEDFVSSVDGKVGIIIHVCVTQPNLKKRKLSV